MRTSTQFAVALASVFSVLQLTLASQGDQLPEFKRCVKYCDILTCDNVDHYPDVIPSTYMNLLKDENLVNLFEKTPISFHLSLLGWDCSSNCDYQCQRLVTDDRIAEGLKVYQFHGKWPFVRVLGVQELFSTLFSIGNWIPNFLGFKLLWKQYNAELRKTNMDMANLYWTYMHIAVVSMCAWFFSTIFHLKDTWDRERLDYFFAGMTVLTGFYAVSVRFFKLYLVENNMKRKIFGTICILLYLGHVTRLLFDWSYTYNMQANVVIGLVQNFLWVYLSIYQFQKISSSKLSFIENVTRQEYNWTLTPTLLVLSVFFGMSFELFDFPPVLQLLDAHAMWHFVTIWPTLFWYPYLVKDAQELMDWKFD
ncbi:hypothetical protein PICMEDRAFT_99118 [Pichia membranifaciens NRRL Y-2026]|uniref:Post-GPI attachment to proteins factor 3 n=1 Tax=Pichia membranifaciens NRRL Y-2026 TaxID=763406 RepID=A0A1E3NT40_9ASCO|nr:hypothetical protein PICMEDRAFT_99118 [Pichia membranifaciens NRRL Y-2026]ODQ49305.1 hypothetical protein PICMEDRAFT_99118 [Pichia membranifaciens NRRL Y-2026]